MIITALANLIYTLLNFLMVFDLPALPATVTTIANQGVSYITGGISIIRTFIGSTALGVLAVLLQLVLLINAAYLVFTLVKFVLKKIPMLNIDM